ncbi:MAG: glycosyltransferase [Candidatus Brocadiaceae bacterium]|nr:glycosyltransferase [Candidatus Brocadiaceae bacterium]
MTKLSVIMATYKENPQFLKTCIESILNQTFRDFEFIIVVEPGETNLDYLKELSGTDRRIKILQNVLRLGVAGSRNRAIEESSGEYIALADGDDYYDLRRFEKQLEFFRNNFNISVVGSNMCLVNECDNIVGRRMYPKEYDDIKRSFLFEMAIANPSVMVRKKDVEEIGFFNDKLFKAEDFDLWLRFLSKNKKMHNLQDNLVYYRTQPNDNKKRGHTHYKNYYNTLKTHSKFIWPFYQRFISLLFFFIVSKIPNLLLDYLVNLKIVKKIKNIRLR